jgi:hypothetical protein
LEALLTISSLSFSNYFIVSDFLSSFHRLSSNIFNSVHIHQDQTASI